MNSRHDSLGFLLADLSRSMRRAFKDRIKGSSLTLAQSRALVNIARNEGVRQVDLAEILEVQPMTLARLIDQLASAGVVERRSDPADRRVYRLFLTPAAAPQLAAIYQVADTIRDQALKTLSAAEAEAVHVTLRKMRANFVAQP